MESSIVYEWKISSMKVSQNHHTLVDVIKEVHWELTGLCEIGEKRFTDRVYGSVGLDSPTEKSFIPFENVSREEVIGWVQAVLGENYISQIKNGIADKINKKINPPLVEKVPFSWMDKTTASASN